MNPDMAMPVVAHFRRQQNHTALRPVCDLKLGHESQNLKIGDKIELVVGYEKTTLPSLHVSFTVFITTGSKSSGRFWDAASCNSGKSGFRTDNDRLYTTR